MACIYGAHGPSAHTKVKAPTVRHAAARRRPGGRGRAGIALAWGLRAATVLLSALAEAGASNLCMGHFATLSMLADAEAAGHLRTTDLRCEWSVDPIGLGEHAPRLSWIVESRRRAERQTAWRILVASTPDLLNADQGDLWDSGRTEGSETLVVYAGAPLRSGAAYHWKVMAWDRDRLPGPWSDPSTWEMGLLDPAEWVAQWIDASPMPREQDRVPLVLRAVYLPASASFEEAWATLSGHEPRQKVSPGVSQTTERPASKVQASDVTAVVAATVARGEPMAATNAALGGDPAFGVPKRLVVEFEVDGAVLRREVSEQGTLRLIESALPLLRRDFTIDRPLRRARLHATALGLYEACLNGSRVGDLALAPGWTDYRKRVHRQTFDVTAQLVPGVNTIGAMVAPGWFSGRAGLFHARAFYGQTPAFACQLELEFEDGTTAQVVTDDSWRQRPGPILLADLMDGETHDARAEVEGWCEPIAAVASDSAWRQVTLRTESRSVESSIAHTVRPLMELSPIAVTEPAPGRYVFDLGQNMVGVVRLRLNQPAGTVVTLRHAEILAPDGTIDTSNLRGAAAIDTYICRGPGGDGETAGQDAQPGPAFEIWQPRFTLHGFRYVELSGLAPTESPVRDGSSSPGLPPLTTVTGIVLGSDLPATGSFRCSDPLLTQLHSNIVWGLRGNAVSIPTDCPQRDERMGWTGDVQVFVPTGTLIADMGLFLEKWMVDLEDAQREDGAHADVAPVMAGLSYGTPGWGDAGTIVPWTLYRRNGDRRVLERHIQGMMRWVDWCERHSEGLLRRRNRGNDYGDWLAIDAPTSKELIGTAYFAHSADCTARALRALGRDGDAARYESLFGRICEAFAAAYIDADGRIVGDTQTAYVLALRFGLVPPALRRQAVEHLVAAIAVRGGGLSTGFLGSGHLLPVLDEAGRTEVAMRLLLRQEMPSWLFPVRHGATTIWERWDGWTSERGAHPDISMNSFNHFAFGACGEWLYGGVAGIAQAPEDVGFERIVIRPRIEGPLEWVEAEHRSVRGRIATAWRRRGADVALKVEIPANATAMVVLPAGRSSIPLESGVPLAEAEGMSVLGRTEDAVIIEIGSGTFEFHSRLARP